MARNLIAKSMGLFIPDGTSAPPPTLFSVNELSIKLEERETPLYSSDLVEQAKAYGATVNEFEAQIFSPSAVGTYRSDDSSDLLSGYPFYESANDQHGKMVRAKQIGHALVDYLEKKAPILARMESEDVTKMTVLRPKSMGRHLELPFEMNPNGFRFCHPMMEQELLALAKIMVSRVAGLPIFRMSPREAMYTGTDAKGTNLGSPTFASHPVLFDAWRIMTLKAYPNPARYTSASKFLDAMYHMGEQLGMPDPAMVYDTSLAYRQGGIREGKSVLGWVFNGMEYVATHDTYNLYSRMRHVKPAPFGINVMATQPVSLMKEARKRMPGFFHTPELLEANMKYASQFNFCYEADYSNYDKTLTTGMMMKAMECLIRAGMPPWGFTFIMEYIERHGALTPAFVGGGSQVQRIGGTLSLQSGMLWTSEIGSFISAAAHRATLRMMGEDKMADAIGNVPIFFGQSDDTLILTNKRLNEDKYVENMKELGLTIKFFEGSTFLKRVYPLGALKSYLKQVPLTGYRLYSRFLGNTLFNENRYDGLPACVIWLALSSRMESCTFAPYFNDFWPMIMDLILPLPIIRESPNTGQWRAGDATLDFHTLQLVSQWAESDKGKAWFMELIERAEYEPSAAAFFNIYDDALSLEEIKAADLSQALKMRARYVDALYSDPTPQDMHNVLMLCRWAGYDPYTFDGGFSDTTSLDEMPVSVQ
jgi:hypothetical protein